MPQYPRTPFASEEAACAWVQQFVPWYNREHLHSGIGFVTPEARHWGRDVAQLEARRAVYEAARAKNPARWSGAPRTWERPAAVTLNAKEHRERKERPAPSVHPKVSASSAVEHARDLNDKGKRQGPKTGPGAPPSRQVTRATPRYGAILEGRDDKSK